VYFSLVLIAFVYLAWAGFGNSSCLGADELPSVPPPREDTPAAWLDRAQRVHDQYQAALRAYANKTGSNDALTASNKTMNSVDVETMARLTSFGKESIQPCIDKIEEASTLSAVATRVLENLGNLSVEPIVCSMSPHGRGTDDFIEIFRGMDDSPGDELARLACTAGAVRINAIRVLAVYIRNSHEVLNRDAALLQPSGISIKYQQPLLVQLHNEQDLDIKCDLLVLQKYFRCTSGEAITEMVQILTQDKRAKLRVTAADLLGAKLDDATGKGAQEIVLALAKALSSSISISNSETIKMACANALTHTKSAVDRRVIRALENAAGGMSNAVRQAALQALCHLAIYDDVCVPYLAEALTEDDFLTVCAARQAIRDLGSSGRAALSRIQRTDNK
jgi:hypothetical protein